MITHTSKTTPGPWFGAFALAASLFMSLSVHADANPAARPGNASYRSLEVLKEVSLPVPRGGHTATRLKDGRILVVGGSKALNDFIVRSVQIFNPATHKLSDVAPLKTPRHGHTATLLPDGRVLVVGGYSLPRQWLDDAEVYDPKTNTWTVIPPRYKHGVSHTATLMRDGRVLVVGGAIDSGVCTDRAEIFDPRSNTWSEAAPLPGERASQGAEPLNDGRVLVVGGGTCVAPGIPVAGGDALLYDPRANVWTATRPMAEPRIFPATTMLPSGRVLAAGGLPWKNVTMPPPRAVTASAEIYDPGSNTWTRTRPLSQARVFFVLETLQNNQVVAVGGAKLYDEGDLTEESYADLIESYNPVARRWYAADIRLRFGTWAAAAMLPKGGVWITGGRVGANAETFLSDTWVVSDRQSMCSFWHY